jgi:hypothetical protein
VLGLVISYALIGVHELGHAVMAKLVGMRVFGITVGHWKRVLSFTVKGITVDIRAAPDSGYVNLDFTVESWRLVPLTAMFLAGIGAEALVMFWTALVPGPTAMDSFADIVVAYARVAIFWIGGWHIVLSLLPREFWIGDHLHRSDGRHIVNFWRARGELAEQRALLAEGRAIGSLRESGRTAEARERTQALVDRCPQNIELQIYLATLCSESGDTYAAEALLRHALDKSGAEPAVRAQVLDSLACLPLYYDRPDLLREAEAWVGEALTASPHAITLNGTRGSILVELGRFDEAIQVLERVAAVSEERTDRGISAAYLAKAYSAKGDRAGSAEWLAQANRLLPEHIVVKRIVAQLTLSAAT